MTAKLIAADREDVPQDPKNVKMYKLALHLHMKQGAQFGHVMAFWTLTHRIPFHMGTLVTQAAEVGKMKMKQKL